MKVQPTARAPRPLDLRRLLAELSVRRSTKITAVIGTCGPGGRPPRASRLSPRGRPAPAPDPPDARRRQRGRLPADLVPGLGPNPLDDLTDPALGEYALYQTSTGRPAVGQQFPQRSPPPLHQPRLGHRAEAFSEQMAAELIHLRPVVAGDDVTDMANPDFLPDFDHNGVYGDPGDFVAMEQGAQGAEGLGSPSTHPATGAFLYPCIADSGAVTYETTVGRLRAPRAPGEHDFTRTGARRAQTIIDAPRAANLAARPPAAPAPALGPGQ